MSKMLERSNTPPYVKEAMRLYSDGFSLAVLAEKYGKTRQAMWDLLRRRMDMRPQLRFGKENHFYRGGRKSKGYAENVLEKALLRGEVKRASKCETCSVAERMVKGRSTIQAHHPDYNKPLDVMWLCVKCHFSWHKNNKPIPRRDGR